MLDRREVLKFGQLITVWPQSKNKRLHHKDELIFRGTIEIPQEIVDKAISGNIYKSVHRHYCARIKYLDVIYLFREWGSSNKYFGEIVKTQQNNIRLHLWKVLDKSRNCKYIHKLNTVKGKNANT